MFDPTRTANGTFAKGYTINGKDTRDHSRAHYKGIKDKWVAENTGKHFCKCGCNGVIKVTRFTYHYGIRDYLSGHNSRVPAIADKQHGNPLQIGENHWNWCGGVTKLRERLRKTKAYTDWRDACYKRDNGTCQHCGNTKDGGFRIEVHHKVPVQDLVDLYESSPDILWEKLSDLSNGITLCEPCHHKMPHPRRKPKPKIARGSD